MKKKSYSAYFGPNLPKNWVFLTFLEIRSLNLSDFLHEVRGLSVLKSGISGFSGKNLAFSKRGLNVYKNFFYKKQTDICGTSE